MLDTLILTTGSPEAAAACRWAAPSSASRCLPAARMRRRLLSSRWCGALEPGASTSSIASSTPTTGSWTEQDSADNPVLANDPVAMSCYQVRDVLHIVTQAPTTCRVGFHTFTMLTGGVPD